MMTLEGRNEVVKQLKSEWERRYFNNRRLKPAEWYSSEKTFTYQNKTNGGRTLYNLIIAEHARKRRFEIGQETVRVLTTLPEEIKDIEKEIGEIGAVKYLKEKYNLDIEQVRTTSTVSHRREVEIVMIENNDEGIVGDEILKKERDRLNKKWRNL